MAMKINSASDVTKLIRMGREKLGYSRPRLADESKVSEHTLKYIETGDVHAPRIDTVLLIFDALGMELYVKAKEDVHAE